MGDIKIDQVTNESGNGAFDIMSKAVLKNLEEQFKQGRITGTEYSKVYVTTIDNVMSQAIQFLLQKDISAAQADLIKAQTVLAETQEQAVQKEILLTIANTTKVNREIELMDDQQALLQAQVLLTNAQVDKTEAEVDILAVEKTKTLAEVQLVNAQVTAASKNIEVLTAQLLNIPKEGALLDKQVLKTTEEITFLSQRIKTEKAQILDVVDGTAVSGILGKQRVLYQAQTDGFTRDAEYKLASLMANTWITRRSTDEGTVADNVNHLSDANIGAVMSKAMVGINVTVP